MTLKRIVAIGAVIPALLTAGIVGAEQGRLAMQIDGKGPVVVLESGMGEARANWQSVVKALAPCFTVVTYDRYGIGESPPPADRDAPVLAADVADTLLSVLRARDLAGPYILVGHSLGALCPGLCAQSSRGRRRTSAGRCDEPGRADRHVRAHRAAETRHDRSRGVCRGGGLDGGLARRS